MGLARALGSTPHLRWELVPTMQWNLSAGVEQAAQEVSSVDAKSTLADQTPPASSLTLWMICALTAGLIVVALIPNLVLGLGTSRYAAGQRRARGA
jgi:hypothetical protein